MSKKALVSVLFSCCFLGSFADNAVKQVVQIAGQTQQEAVKSLTFNGNEVTVTFRNGLTTVARLDSLTISFTGTATAIRKVVGDQSRKDNGYYSLNGVRTKPVGQGVYIHNGKKIIKTK